MVWSFSLARTKSFEEMQRLLVSRFYGSSLGCCNYFYSLTRLGYREILIDQGSTRDWKPFKNNLLFVYLQYAFLVTASVQFAGGVIVFFGLLTSPKEVGK